MVRVSADIFFGGASRPGKTNEVREKGMETAMRYPLRTTAVGTNPAGPQEL